MRNYFAPQFFRMGRISAQIFFFILLVFSIIDKTVQKRYNYNGEI